MDEAGRPPPGGQRPLPLAAIETRDEAYLAAVDDLVAAGLPRAPAELLRWIIREGTRKRPLDPLRAPRRTRRHLAATIGIGLGTVSRAIERLRAAHLLIETVDGLELNLPMLLDAAEQAASQRQMALEPVSAADSLAALTGTVPRVPRVPSCSTCSTPRPYRKEKNLNTVSVPTRDPSAANTVTVTGAAEQVERGGTDGTLRGDPAWKRLQTKHLRPEIDLTALRPAFYAAVDAGLIDATHECKLRWLATVYDVARDRRINSPAVVLRYRTEQRTCYRISDEGRRWAIGILRPTIHAKERPKHDPQGLVDRDRPRNQTASGAHRLQPTER